jgi:hypothetical protein
LSFVPSNGLGPSLAESRHQSDIVLLAGTRIDTDLGIIQDANGTTVPVKTALVTQVGGPEIRVFEAKSFAIADTTVQGSKPIALVAAGAITLTGRFLIRGHGVTGAAGALYSGACVGNTAKQNPGDCSTPNSFGTGGGGNFQKGGVGGVNVFTNAGAAITSSSPLVGGCAGGSQLDMNEAIVARGGGGGGGLQLVSSTSISLRDQGLVDLGGAGGQSTTGGGSGGTLILEAPAVSITGPATGVVANGGAGGGCGKTGPDGSSDKSSALGPACQYYFGGNGGTGATAPGNGCVTPVDGCSAAECPVVYGGGGGSVGRMRIATTNGTYATSGNPIFSVHIDTATLTR